MTNDDHMCVLSVVSQRLSRRKSKLGGVLPEGEIAKFLDNELSNEEYDVDRDELLKELESNFETLIGNATSLRNQADVPAAPWVSEQLTSGDLHWEFWLRYRNLLFHNGWPEPVISKLDKTTTEILDSIIPPQTTSPWEQKGLIVGHVQSGKTANYIGLICKAVDAGFRVVIVLAGAHNSLRTQTQIRLEEGFLGYQTIDEDIEYRVPTGAGLIGPKIQHKHMPNTLTTRGEFGDFKTAIAKSSGINPGGNPLLFVVKKNTTVLKNLHNWVQGVAKTQGSSQDTIRGVPLLVIDDESDYASVDTKKQGFDEGELDPEHDPTKINGLIRKILESFEQRTYIGYTATPFANIFISEGAKAKDYGKDLFPESFIFSIPAPSNYVGPNRMFGLDGNDFELPIFRIVADHADTKSVTERAGWIPPRHDKSHIPRTAGKREIPSSLKTAIQSFLIAAAARKARGQTSSHNSMLIHVTRFVDVQARVMEQVDSYFLHLQDRIVYGDGSRDPSIFDELQALWESDFEQTSLNIADPDCTQLTWEDVHSQLKNAVQSIVVRQINGSSGDVLEYDKHAKSGKPFDVIAIGGDKLSRGLTLEGLTVSYFLRHSKMYDTLMQMGRWFGYRPGYLDLCRVYTTADLRTWFKHISVASEELRSDFSRMVSIGCTPLQFGHRVLCHPQLMVTSPTKMRHTEKRKTSFDGCPAETILFSRKPEVVSGNFTAYKKLYQRVLKDEQNQQCLKHPRSKPGGDQIWEKVSPEHVLEFLKEYQGYSAARAHPQYLRDYIEKQLKRGKLAEWTVLFGQGVGGEEELAPGHKVSKVERAWHKPPPDPTDKDPYRVRRVASRDEAKDLTPVEHADALKYTICAWEKEGKTSNEPKIPSGPYIRTVRPPERGLICLYSIDPKEFSLQKEPLVGFLISFPGDADATPIEYQVGDVYRRLEEEGIWDD